MIEVGDQLPKFEALQQDGKTVKSADYQGKKLVIFFYPQAGTPTCTVEACNLGNHYQELQNAGFQVIGVSPDSVAKQKKFQEKHQLPFDLIADTEHELVNKFGVWREKKTFGKTYMGTVRTTFVFDENSVCIRVIEKVQSKRAAEQILES